MLVFINYKTQVEKTVIQLDQETKGCLICVPFSIFWCGITAATIVPLGMLVVSRLLPEDSAKKAVRYAAYTFLGGLGGLVVGGGSILVCKKMLKPTLCV